MGNLAAIHPRKNIIVVLVILALCLSNLWSGTTGKIMGTVTDQANGEPLVGANVIIEESTMGSSTDQDGFYYIINIPPGTYSVTVSYMGYGRLTQSDVRVMVDRTTGLDFVLSATAIAGEEVIVTAQRPIIETDVTGSQNILDIGFIERAPIADIDDALRQQAGIYNTGETSFLRGGLASEINYILDGTSLNSGIISDNYQRLNITAVQEISVLTGGYSAEYGQAMSGVVNVISREPSTTKHGIHGTIKYRMRPPGNYHWGKNMYDRSLWIYSYYDTLGYWETNLENSRTQTRYAKYFERFYGPGTATNDPKWDGVTVPTAEELRDTYRQQLTPDPVLGNYTERSEEEYEASFYGSLFNNISFLFSGRYKRGVNIYPQALPYNPEYNLQTRLTYHVSRDSKLILNVLHGWYKTASFSESNWNNLETSQEARWQPNAEVRHPYWEDTAFGPWGGNWLKGPQEKTFNMMSLNWQQALSPATFYTLQVSYLSDYMTEKQDYAQLTTDLETLDWGDSWYDLASRYRLESRLVRLGNWSDSKIFTVKGDLTSQVHRAHQIKTGVELKQYDLDYQHYWFEFPSGDIWHLDNVFSGKPMEIASYLQDKIEYPKSGIVANLGLRVSAFNTQQKYPGSIYDPLGFQEWNGGDGDNPSNTTPIWQAHRDPNDWFMIDSTVAYYIVDGEPIRGYKHFFPDSVLSDGNTVASEWKIAIAPRIGISFPITANSKLRFNYGHFYQRPSWSKLMGFPTSWYESDPLGSVRMDQWMGWYGQPGLTWERTIQYEIGFTQNILNVFRLDIVGYYKDASGLTRFSYGGTYNNSGGFAQTWFWSPETFSTARNAANDGHDNVFYTNNAYKDMRGVEVTLDKLFNNRWSASLNFNFGVTTGGATGHWQYNEDSTRIHQPWGFEESKLTWITNYMIKGNVEYVTPRGLGPLGLLGDINLGVYSEYFAGPQYTYYPKDYTGLQTPNNKRWYPHVRTDLKLVKRVTLGKVTPVIGLEVFNLFNNYDRNLLGGDDLIAWEEGEYYTDPETGEEIKIRDHRPPQALAAPVALDEYGRKTEDDIWWFYNSISNPKRMIYLNLSLEF